MLASDLPASEKTTDRLHDEGMLIIGAGSHTVGWALTVGVFHMLANKTILSRLQTELAPIDFTAPATHLLPQLAKLPYLTAVLKEALRLSYGVAERLPRSAPDEVLLYKEWAIPKGTSISQHTVLLHHNEEIFPDSKKFVPDRFLGKEADVADRYMVAFSGGSRACLGINMAWAELVKFIFP